MKKILFIILVLFLILSTVGIIFILNIEDYTRNKASDIPITSPQEKYASIIEVENWGRPYELLEPYDEVKAEYNYTPKAEVKYKLFGKTYVGVEPKLSKYPFYTEYQPADPEQFKQLIIYASGEIRSISFNVSNEEVNQAAENPIPLEDILIEAEKLVKDFIDPTGYEISIDEDDKICEIEYSKKIGDLSTNNFILFRFQLDGKLISIKKGPLESYENLNFDMDKALEAHYQKCDSTIALLPDSFSSNYNKLHTSIGVTLDGVVCLATRIYLDIENYDGYADLTVFTRLSD